MNEIWQEYLHVQFNPAHIMAELGFTLVFYGLVIALLLPLFRKTVNNINNTLHRELDEEHGVAPHE